MPEEKNCLNCGTVMERRYCPECGQEWKPAVLPIDELLRDVLEEFLKFDSRLFRTLGTLFARPGHLTQEFLEGRRSHYLTPFKLYFTASFVFLLVLVLTGWDRELSREFVGKTGDAEPLRDWLGAQGGWLMALSIPWGALMLKWMHRPRLYMEHLVFATHMHAMSLLVITPSLLTRHETLPDLIVSVITFAWTYVALRRVYETSWLRTLLQVIALWIGYLFFLGVVVTIALAITGTG
jgi:hypothetical protein